MLENNVKSEIKLTTAHKQAIEDLAYNAEVAVSVYDEMVKKNKLFEKHLTKSYERYVTEDKRVNGEPGFVPRLRYFQHMPQAKDLREEYARISKLDDDLIQSLEIFKEIYDITEGVGKSPKSDEISRAAKLCDEFFVD